ITSRATVAPAAGWTMASRVASLLAGCGWMTPLRVPFSRSLAQALLRRPLLPGRGRGNDGAKGGWGPRGGSKRRPMPAVRPSRQDGAAGPANRLVTGELEARWNKALARVAEVEAKIAAHDAATVPSTVDPASFATLAADLKSVWTTPTTDARLKKRIVRTVILS